MKFTREDLADFASSAVKTGAFEATEHAAIDILTGATCTAKFSGYTYYDEDVSCLVGFLSEELSWSIDPRDNATAFKINRPTR